jgi:hypothetical protein
MQAMTQDHLSLHRKKKRAFHRYHPTRSQQKYSRSLVAASIPFTSGAECPVPEKNESVFDYSVFISSVIVISIFICAGFAGYGKTVSGKTRSGKAGCG